MQCQAARRSIYGSYTEKCTTRRESNVFVPRETIGVILAVDWRMMDRWWRSGGFKAKSGSLESYQDSAAK